ncbi:double-stranded RNA-binding protein 1-like isoform X2 [Benincasa hispida]|uniref:double-stranded RNA-binding protein 1-like isoform X2 n=1 Tax=Benincasa hispida TaxID=102211 RepID=UPI0019016C5C|nr:double-stranded RNA-binding protein 1-like isoform X2 [Benincasa hispida]
MFKTQLQELCHRKSYQLPEYSVVKQGQDHDPRFEATVTVDGKQFSSLVPCKSSKQAQNEAAKIAFDFFSLPSSPQPPLQPDHSCPQPLLPESSPPPKLIPCIPPFSHSSLDVSSFPQPTLPSHLGSIGAITNLDNTVTSPLRPEVTLEVANESFELEKSPKAQLVEPKIQNTDKSPVVEDFDKECLKLTGMQHLYKNKLQNLAQKRGLSLPMYTCERDGPPHASRFRCKVEIDGKTYESPEFHGTLKDAENAVAKVALLSLCQDGAQEDSGLYKNLLQEMAQKRGLGLPIYSTSQSGEVHVPVFVSTVKVGEETSEGKPSRTKKQAEMSAAKVAYFTIKEGKIASPRERDSQAISSSLQSNVSTDQDLQVISSPVISHPSMSIEKQPNDGGSQSISTRKRAPSCDLGIEASRDIAISSHNVAHLGESNDYVSNLLVSKLEAGKSSSSKRVIVCPRQPNMTFPKGTTVLPISDDEWVTFSVETGTSQ